MECKFLRSDSYSSCCLELIDTLWNVNPSMWTYAVFSSTRELIDTLWNVNKYKGKSKSLVDARINRYIMECK